MPRPATSDILRIPIPPPAGGDFGGRGPDGGRGAGRRASLTALVLLLASTAMIFATLTSVFVARRAVSDDWTGTPVPRLFWPNTAVLLASSAALHVARRRLRSGRRAAFNRWWTAGAALGLLFLAGQALAWRELRAAGVFLSSNPSAALFYVLTAAHAAHLLGGACALLYVGWQAWRFKLGPARRTAVDVSALFWHFLDLLWLYLMALFVLWA